MIRELKNGDLVRVNPECLAQTWEGYSEDGLLGVVVDDIDAHEEVKCYHIVGSVMSFQWWNVESLELISAGR